MQTINSGAPGVVDYGVDDQSTRPYSRGAEETPQHCPKFWIYAQKGPTSEELLVGDDRILMYGEDTFVERSPYFNHQTKFSNSVNAKGNAAMYVRVLPTDIGPKPSIRAYIDVLPTLIDLYERNLDGSIKTNVSGDPIVNGTTPGFRVKIVTDYLGSTPTTLPFGQATIKAGDQTNGTTTSQRFPLFDLEHSFYGSDGMLAGIRLWAQTEDNVSIMPTKLMAREKAYPYSLSVIRKNSATGNVKPVSSVFGEQTMTVTMKQDVIDPTSTSRLYFGERVVEDYQNLTDPKYAKKYGEFGRVHVYQENIETLLAMFQAAEVPFIDESYDFTADVADKHLFNFITGTTSQGVPYQSYVFTDTGNSVRLSQSTNVFTKGGSDGTMSHAGHAALVSEYMERYKNPDDELNDIAYHVESHIHDSGFPLLTKYSLINFISQRKDTIVTLSPTEFGQPALSPSEEYSVAASLRARLDLHPESSYFGTPVFRALIQGSAGRVRGSAYIERFPLTHEIAVKSAAFMGAGNGRWKPKEKFDGQPGSIIETQFDLTNPWTPQSVRNRNWDIGLNWVQRHGRESFFFPALKTVYSDDTSVLTSYITACAIAYLNKITQKIHRMFSGRSDLTPAQFTDAVNSAYSAEVKDIFDGRFVVVPKAFFSSMDQVRNYSWTLPVEIYAPGMQTVMTAYTVARRIQDLGT